MPDLRILTPYELNSLLIESAPLSSSLTAGVLSHRESLHLAVRVYYEDTDSAGVVYYANYLKFMERARTEWLRSLGYEQDTLAREAGIVFMVRSVELHYRRPARFNDLLQVSTRIEEIKKASLLFAQTILRSGEDEHPLCNGHIRVACVAVDSLKPRAIPPLLLAEMAP